MTKPTRAEHLDRTVSHEQYYEAIAAEAGVCFDGSSDLPRIVEAIREGDKYLNSIPLPYWDGLAYAARPAVRPVLKAHGDFWSVAGGVCTAKAAARKSARKFITQEAEQEQ